jgi:predicted acetyltransferase
VTSTGFPSPALNVRLATVADCQPLQRMLELYQYELSDFWDQDLDAAGEYGYALDRYWSASSNYPYVALVDGRYAGFALVDDQVKLPGGQYWMDQFFVLKKYRSRGVGKALAADVIRCHPGEWQIGQMADNHPAQAFWRKTIGALTGGNFKETAITTGWWQGVVQQFTSR